MRVNSKKHWNSLIYGLVYPGFLGSMIYELIPTTQSDVSKPYLTLSILIKVIITLFYMVDYLHVYGDMHGASENPKRSWIHLFCDFGSSTFFFIAFVFVKLDRYYLANIFLALVPAFFAFYKRGNRADRKFHIPYLFTSLLVCLVYWINPFWHRAGIQGRTDELFLTSFSLLSFLTYVVYVFVYYDRESAAVPGNETVPRS
jgi:hypothetical protein